MGNKLIQSYVWHDDKCFFVSTINRESSAALAYGKIYAETMIWEYDYDKRERGELIGQDEDVENSIETHNEVCREIHKNGILEGV
jgi:hypothetical protein